MRFAEIFKTELFSKYGQKAGCYINEIYDIMNILTKCRKRFGRADECFQYLVHSVHENGIGESAISYDIECRKKIQRNVILENYNRYMK